MAVVAGAGWWGTKLLSSEWPIEWKYALAATFFSFLFIAVVSAAISFIRLGRRLPEGSGAVYRLRSVSAELHQRTEERDNALEALRVRTSEREGCEQQYQLLKRRFTLDRFERFCERYPNLQVTIRSAGYTADWPIVQQIKELIEAHAKWTVALDPNNQPPLLPSDTFKVIVDWDSSGIDRLHSFLDVDDGRLLEHKVGMLRNPHGGLIISVLPTVPSQ